MRLIERKLTFFSKEYHDLRCQLIFCKFVRFIPDKRSESKPDSTSPVKYERYVSVECFLRILVGEQFMYPLANQVKVVIVAAKITIIRNFLKLLKKMNASFCSHFLVIYRTKF